MTNSNIIDNTNTDNTNTDNTNKALVVFDPRTIAAINAATAGATADQELIGKLSFALATLDKVTAGVEEFCQLLADNIDDKIKRGHMSAAKTLLHSVSDLICAESGRDLITRKQIANWWTTNYFCNLKKNEAGHLLAITLANRSVKEHGRFRRSYDIELTYMWKKPTPAKTAPAMLDVDKTAQALALAAIQAAMFANLTDQEVATQLASLDWNKTIKAARESKRFERWKLSVLPLPTN